MTRSTRAAPLLAPLLLLMACPPAAADLARATRAPADLAALVRPLPRGEHRELLALAATTAPAHEVAALPRNAVAALAPAPAPAPTVTLAAAAAPAAAPVAATPAAATPVARPAAAAADARFDLAINNAPAAQVFLQLAQGTAWNMLVSPEVSGSLSIALRDTTVPEAMETLRELFGYEYRITGNRIFVYPNTVQTRLYRVNYLPGRRQGASDIRVSSSAMTGSGSQSNGAPANATGSGGGGHSSSSQRPDDNAHVRTTSDADFWREVQASLAALVGSAGGRSVVLNPAAGVVVVKATPAELRQVEQYLKAVQLAIERQVMLEAKIVEVSLSKDAQTGINWGAFGKLGSGQLSIGSAAPGSRLGTSANLVGADGTSIAPGVDLAAGALGRGFYGLAFQAANFAALLNFLQTQGDVSVLSSPRIATLNNQKAVLKVGSDELYVTGVTTTSSSNGSTTTSSPSLTLQPFFSGISLDVTPQIDEGGNVMLHVHPTISSVTEKQKNIDLGSLGAFRLPLAASAVNETDSIVRVRDGQIVAIGGLMKQELRDERTGLPVVSEAPVVGALFRQSGTVVSKRELVIMLKPTVIQDGAAWPEGPSLGGLPAPAAAPTR
ncbi:MAG TPA: pilus (MSHA type) biogenesis protein MshL [Aquabacterium sp.]|nr:pilus (MSHA type) biogenesis protein MshL [Aquabacterium sp.]HQC96635.1 pilus (MSHA type) biogenesis protein MshL [Aquabacterium sp.]